jgi:putative transposase
MVADPPDCAWSTYRANGQAVLDTIVVPHGEYLRPGADGERRCAAYRAPFKDVLATIGWRRSVPACNSSAYPERHDSSTIEATIGRCASVRAAHWPWRSKSAAGSGSDPL